MMLHRCHPWRRPAQDARLRSLLKAKPSSKPAAKPRATAGGALAPPKSAQEQFAELPQVGPGLGWATLVVAGSRGGSGGGGVWWCVYLRLRGPGLSS